VLTNRATREKLLAAAQARGSRGGEFDNREVVLQLARLRAERAELLGYASHAAYSLEDQNAKNTTAVNQLLSEFAVPAVRNARQEAAEIQQVIDAEKGGFAATAYDWNFYSDKVRAAKYAFDANVLFDGVFFSASKLYGLTFKERKDLPVYDPDVRVFDIFNEDGSQLAIFVIDPYARANKRGGAWMSALVSQSTLLGQKPVIANNLNLAKPAAGEPTLLTWDEVRTTFHEMGHGLHGMFSEVKYPRFSGTRVPRDYVELPSQVNEMWMAWPEVLTNYAKHYQTGAPMPKELLDKLRASQKFNEGYRTTEYLAASILDQSWHQLGSKAIPADVRAFEAKALKDAGIDFPLAPPRYSSTYFSHAMSGGYSAGYYSYLWAEKLDADAGEWFKENGGLLRKNGERFRKMVLSKGGTMDAMDMYRGRDAEIQPLLERRGLTAQ
jgi:peptidyl-dipeptidase Dcp